MQEIKKDHIIQETSSFSWKSSIVILCITILSILGFYGYHYYVSRTIEALNKDIVELDTIIQSGSLDKEVIIGNIILSTSIRPPMDLQGIVRNFHKTAENSGLRLSGFNIQDDILTTNLISTQESIERDPVEKIIKMMQTPDLIPFSLEPIYGLQGTTSERSTPVSFRILSSKPIDNGSK